MIDLHRLANMPGAGEAHSELCREGHPTECPRFPGEIEYEITMTGPRGGKAVVEVMASSVPEAEKRARELVWQFDLLEVTPYVDSDDDIKIKRVRAYD